MSLQRSSLLAVALGCVIILSIALYKAQKNDTGITETMGLSAMLKRERKKVVEYNGIENCEWCQGKRQRRKGITRLSVYYIDKI